MKKALIVLQQCYHCGRDMDRALSKTEKAEFLEDHPEFPMGMRFKETERSVIVPLPETKCDPCIDQELEYRCGGIGVNYA